MANIANLINLVVCTASAVYGTGLKGCILFLKKVRSFWLIDKDFSFDGSQGWNETYLKQLQAEGKVHVFNNVRTFTDNSSDDQIETLEDGSEQVTTLGLYKFLFQFIGGLYNHIVLSSFSGFGRYRIVFIDRDGTALGTKDSSGDFTGLTLGMHQGQKLTFPSDAAAQREGFAVQLLERSELDADMAYIPKNADFNPLSLTGVNEVTLSYTTTPSDTDTTISIKAVRTSDGKPFTGIDFSDFNLKVNNVTANPTAGDDSAEEGTYVLTLAAAAVATDVQAISLYDNVNNRSAIEVGGDLFKSKTISATVVA